MPGGTARHIGPSWLGLSALLLGSGGSAGVQSAGRPESVVPASLPAVVVDTPAALDAEKVKAILAAAPVEEPPDFSGQDLSGLDLHGLDFKRAVLVKARLAGSDLTGANLFSCDLTDAVLTEAKLGHANMDGTTLRRADLRRADLRGASLFATIIEAADLSGADLSETRIIGYLKKAKLVGTKLQGANIGADPGNQSMGVMRASFVGGDLTGADFSGSNLFKADFSHASLKDAVLRGVNLGNGDLVETDFTGADVTDMNLSQADISGAIFTRAKGVKTIKGLAEARNRDKAVFDEPVE